MNLAHLLARSARVRPDAPAIFHGTHLVCNYREFAHRAMCIAGYLRNTLQLAPGERVALFMTNNPEYLEVLYGIWYAGLVAVPINAKLHAREVEFILQDAGACALFASADLSEALSTVQSPDLRAIFTPGSERYGEMLQAAPVPQIEPRAPDDLAWLFYTSGTTGRPKGVIESHANLLAMAMCYFTDVDPANKDDAIVYAAPMSHGAGLYCVPHVLIGARHVIPESGGFDPQELVALATHHRNMSMFAAPTMVKRLVEHVAATGADPSGFKTIVYGGGPMYVEDIRHALTVMGDRFVQIYGQGESPMTITALSRAQLADRNHPRYQARLASVGIAHSMVEVRVADADGNALPPDTVGEVLVKGMPVMQGYWNNPQASAQALHDGWLLTGDMGSMDADGFLTLRDRSKDVIISGGSNIYPREVEEVLLLDPAVQEVSVVGRPHPEWGEEVIAFVVTHAGKTTTAAALDTLCLDHIARFKRPKEYRFIDALPKNNYGKVLKTELRKKLAETMSNASSPVIDAATILAARRKSGEKGARLPESCRPLDIDTALAVQSAVTKQLGERIGAWKCGMPAEGRVVAATIHVGTIHTASPCPASAHAGQVKVEPELAFILAHDLPAREQPYTSAEVDAAIAGTHLALELIDSRYSDPAAASFAENLADGLLNQGLFIGPQVDGEQARTTGTMAIRVTHADGREIELEGRHPNADPRAPLYWLAEFLRSKGQGLQAGQAVITGSYAGTFTVPAEQLITIRYGALGMLEVHFTQK